MIKDNLLHIQGTIARIAKECDRDPNQITLIAVSKTKPCSAIELAINLHTVLLSINICLCAYLFIAV